MPGGDALGTGGDRRASRSFRATTSRLPTIPARKNHRNVGIWLYATQAWPNVDPGGISTPTQTTRSSSAARASTASQRVGSRSQTMSGNRA